jgi:hypothetical protein
MHDFFYAVKIMRSCSAIVGGNVLDEAGHLTERTEIACSLALWSCSGNMSRASPESKTAIPEENAALTSSYTRW